MRIALPNPANRADPVFFHVDEFACPCCGAVRIMPGQLAALYRLRKMYGAVMITPGGGGYRCPAFQAALHAARREMGRRSPEPKIASHTLGAGTDVHVLTLTGSRMRFRDEHVPVLERMGFSGIGFGAEGRWMHLDTAHEDRPEHWEYSW